jgi:hypothetical protein
MNELSASELADLAGVTKAEVERMVDLGVLVACHRAAPFLASDVQKLRLATACEQAGLPMDGIAAAIRAGRLSFAFLEAQQYQRYQRYQRYAARSSPTYRQVSQETGCGWSCFAEPWSRRALPGRLLTTRCGPTSWRWCRCCNGWRPPACWTWPG